MGHIGQGNTRVVHIGSSLSLLAAMFACLILWGGITLLMTHPTHPHATTFPDEAALPRPVAQWEEASPVRRSLTDLFLFWLPIGLGAVACGTGVLALICCRGQSSEASRRVIIALLLSAIAGCLCTTWYLVFAASPYLTK